MATTVSSTTFLSQYNDDYRDSDHYHRILFNNGRALQARELTQLQTIIQAEIARIGEYLFNEGSIFNASATISSDAIKSTPYVVVQSLPATPSILKGLTITGPSISGNNITAVVKAVVPAASSPDGRNYLMISYIDGASTTATNTAVSPRTFGANETLTYTYGGSDFNLTTQVTNTAASPVTGFGSMAEVPSFATYVAGHMIFVEKQSLVIDAKNPIPSETIGFVLNQQIITAGDDISLYDNSGSTPNITSPGADRLKITMTLAKQSAISASDTFYPLYKMISGNIVAENKSNSISGELGTRIRNERKSITGDYIVRGAYDQYALDVVEDSADRDYLVYRVGAGIAFVNGNKVERGEYRERVLKPRDTINDVTEKTNEFVAASYGNYFLAHEDSAEGIVRHISTNGLVNLRTGLVHGGSTIGTARVRAVDKYNEYYRIHVFDVDMDSNGSGVEYNLGSTRSIGTSAVNDWANITPIEGEYRLVDKEMNAAFFQLAGGRVYDVDGTSVTGAVTVVRSATASGGTATFTVTAPSVFTDTEQWIVQVDSSGELFPAPTISAGGAGSSSVTVSGLPNGTVTLYGFEQRTLVRKSKTLNVDESEAGVTVSAGEFALSKADIYKFKSIVDDVTGDDVSYKFDLDTGQRDSYYDVGRGKLRRGQTQTNTITVTYDYFSHSAGDYFCGKSSYPNVEYEDIPYHTTASGLSYHLANVIDMRPRKNTSGTFSGGDAYIEPIPRNTDILTVGTVRYWQPRIDIISISQDGKITVTKGDTKDFASRPLNIPQNDLILHQVNLNPYTLNVRDLKSISTDLRGYKMADIRKLDNRIQRLEAYTTLNAAEIRNLKVAVGDPNGGADRQNLGLTADTFTTNLQSNVTSNDFRATVGANMLMPKQIGRELALIYDSAESENIVQKGATLWPTYQEEVMLDLSVASSYQPINEFDFSRTVGNGKIYPAVDNWTKRKFVEGKGTGAATTTSTDQVIVDNWSADKGSLPSWLDLLSALRKK